MANILITGMTSPQTSSRLGEKSLSFARAIYDIASENGHNVAFVVPSISMRRDDFNRYDMIIVGVAPPLSIVSSRAYAALHVIDELIGDPRLMFLVDTSAPERITANLRAIEKDFSTMTREFHSKRPNYEAVVLNDKLQMKIRNALSFLAMGEWPSTIVPAMPWTDAAQIAGALPSGVDASTVIGINPDSYYLKKNVRNSERNIVNRWVVDSPGTKWSELVAKTLTYPQVPMKMNKGTTDSGVYERIRDSVGVLLSPDNNGTLQWSHRWAQALNANTPIASDWRTTSMLGESWSHLGAGIEAMSPIDLYELSTSQRIEYAEAIPTRDSVMESLQQTIGA